MTSPDIALRDSPKLLPLIVSIGRAVQQQPKAEIRLLSFRPQRDLYRPCTPNVVAANCLRTLNFGYSIVITPIVK
jgi:hypothetical protein